MNVLLPLAYIEPIRDWPAWVVGTIFGGPIVIGLTIYFYKTRYARLWRKGIFPEKLKFNQDNLLEAYLALGALLVLADYANSKNKTQFINQYFNRYFPKENYSFGDSLLFSMKHPIKIDTVCNWLNQHLTTEAEKEQVIYFLTGIALIDEKATHREIAFLSLMNEKLQLKPESLHRIISIYKAYFARKKREEAQTNVRTSNGSTNLYYEILGLSKEATTTEIKKAYRKLAKVHHPDLFTSAPEAQQKIAQEKFIEIQEAYEALMERGGEN